MDRKHLQVPSEIVTNQDLEIGFSLARRFDLVVCLEVTEHLPERCATTFVESLTNQSDLILLSAAIPFQGGHHHVNEQFLDYWVKLFAIHAYRPLDFVRPRIWTDSRVIWWLRLNPMPAGVVQSHLPCPRICRRLASSIWSGIVSLSNLLIFGRVRNDFISFPVAVAVDNRRASICMTVTNRDYFNRKSIP